MLTKGKILTGTGGVFLATMAGLCSLAACTSSPAQASPPASVQYKGTTVSPHWDQVTQSNGDTDDITSFCYHGAQVFMAWDENPGYGNSISISVAGNC